MKTKHHKGHPADKGHEKSASRLSENGQPPYRLSLYVSGTSPASMRAISNLKALCEQHLKGRYTLEVVDLYQNPGLAREVQLVAAPTLVKHLPLPIRRLVGDMSVCERVKRGLDLD